MDQPKKRKPADLNGKKKVKKVRRVRRVRRSELEAVGAPVKKKVIKKKRVQPLEVDTSFYDEQPKKKRSTPSEYRDEPTGEKKKKKRGRGCRDWFFGSCTVLLFINLFLMGVLVYFANQAVEALREKDTEQLIEYFDEQLQGENADLYQGLFDSVVAPEAENALNESFGNINSNELNTDFPIFPSEDEENSNLGF